MKLQSKWALLAKTLLGSRLHGHCLVSDVERCFDAAGQPTEALQAAVLHGVTTVLLVKNHPDSLSTAPAVLGVTVHVFDFCEFPASKVLRKLYAVEAATQVFSTSAGRLESLTVLESDPDTLRHLIDFFSSEELSFKLKAVQSVYLITLSRDSWLSSSAFETVH